MCYELKPLEEFYIDRSRKNGRTSRCRKCLADVNRANRGRPKARASLLVGAARQRASAKGLPFDLTTEWVLERILRGVCEATGKTLSLDQPAGDATVNLWAPSIDKVVPSLGYTQANCKIVCAGYNFLKNDCTEEEALRFLTE